MSDLKRLLIFAAFMAGLAIFGLAMSYRDDEANPWYVEAAMSLLFSSPYLLGILVVGLLIRRVAQPTKGERRRSWRT
jgi:hypothetical protein